MELYVEKPSKFAALRYRDFRLLWIAQFISNAGSQMQIVGLNWHIYILTNSAFALGLIGLSRFIPIVLFSLLGGMFADAHNRKRMLFISTTALTVLSVILTFTTYLNATSPLAVYLVTIASAIAMSFEMPARQALIPSLVDRRVLPNAMSLNTIMFQTSTIIGPSIAGFFIGQFGVGSIYGFNAVSFIAVLVSLYLMKTSGDVEGQTSEVSLQALKEGIHFVLSRTIIWSTMLLDFFSTFFSSATALLPIFATEILQVGPEGLGFLYAAPAIGAVIAGYAMAHAHHVTKQGKILLWSVAFYGAATVIFGISNSFGLSLFALLLMGLGDGVSTVIRNTVRQLATPDYIRGRMTSVNMIFFMGGPQLGEFEAGILAAIAGAQVSVITGGLATLAVVGIMAFSIRVLRTYTAEESSSSIL